MIDLDAEVSARVAERVAAARRRREGLGEFYAWKQPRRTAGVEVRHRRKLARREAS